MDVNVFYPEDFLDAQKSADKLIHSNPTVLGFDLEAVGNIVSLISLADNENVYLFQISRIGKLPTSLVKILESGEIRKAGVAWKNDQVKLNVLGIKLSGMVELSDLAAIKGLPRGLKELYNSLFPESAPLIHIQHKDLDWNGALNEVMLNYAAWDARAGLLIVLRLLNVDVKNPETNDVDINAYIEWLVERLNVERNILNITNITNNSYGPWSKLQGNVRSNYIKRAVETAVRSGKVVYDSLTEKYVRKDIRINAEDPKLTIDDLTRINGLSMDSAINWLFNSCSKMSKVSPESRKNKISQSLVEFLERGVLTKNYGKLYLNKKD